MLSATPRARRRLVTTVLAIAVTVSACGDDTDDAASDGSAADVTTAGSASPDVASVPTSSPGSAVPATAAPDTTTADTATATADTVAPGSTAADTTATDPDAAAPTATDAAAAPGSSAPDQAPTGSTAPVATGADGTAIPSASGPVSTPPATYVVVEGDSLFGIAQQAGVTVEALVAANGWTDGDAHTILPGDVVQLPGTVIPEGAVTARDVLELELADGVSSPIAEPLADGVYFALTAEPTADDTAITLELAQFETTEACQARLTASTTPGGTIDDAECLGYHVVESPTATIEVPVEDGPPVIVLFPAPPDVVDLLAYETTTDVWRQLLAGEGPAWSSVWLPGNAFVEITDGAVTRVEVSVIGS